jgi:N-acetylglucosamine kinase-like BadF-type ATPase
MEAILALDGGASRTRCIAIDSSGHILGQAESGPSNHLQAEQDDIEKQIAEVTEKTLRAAHLSREEIVCLSAGLAGVDYDGYGQEPMRALFHRMGFTRCFIYGDMRIAHAAALAMKPGIVIIAGTGSAVLGIDNEGRVAKVGGWGPLYGDEGSAHSVSVAALRAAARAYDGRGPGTALVEAVTSALGLKDFRETISVLYGPGAARPAHLCPVVHRIAMEGDAIARSLFEAAAAELAESVSAAARALQFAGGPLDVSYQGGAIEGCTLLVQSLEAVLSRQLPHTHLVPPRWPPVIGAYLLACSALCWEGVVEDAPAAHKVWESRAGGEFEMPGSRSLG